MQSSLEIIVVTFNNKTLLERTLPSLMAEVQRVGAKLTIVDNNSRDGTADWVKRTFPSIRLIQLEKNVGFARANNIGLGGCFADYVLFLNPDVIVPQGSLEFLLDWAIDQEGLGIVGPRLNNADGSLQYSCRNFPTPLTYIFELLRLDELFSQNTFFGRYMMTYADHSNTMNVDYVCGAAMLVRMDVLKDVGGFDEKFFIYAEEAELCWRVKKKGYRVVYWPGVAMIHLGGESTKGLRKEMYSELIRSRWWFFVKTTGYLSALVYLLIAMGYSLLSGKQLSSKHWRA